MKTTYELLEAIEINSIWIIGLLVTILIFLIGVYTIMCRLEKWEKEKREDRKIIEKLLEEIKNNTGEK